MAERNGDLSRGLRRQALGWKPCTMVSGSVRSGVDIEICGETGEFCDGADVEFTEDAHAVDLDGLFAGVEVGGGLFIEFAGDEVGHDLAFAGSEGGETFACVGGAGVVGFAGGCGGEGGVDGGEEVGVVDWFGEDVEGAVFHGADGEGDGAVAGEEDDGDVAA
jgi:hypothetical protein